MKKIILFILTILVVLGIFKVNEQNIFIPDNSIRLRVIPNSNSPEDIYIKERVKDYLETNVYLLTKDSKNIEEARSIIKKNIPSIEDNINIIFTNNKYTIPYDVNYGYNYFPKKIYKGITYKEGYYESLVISIGEAKGDNWWCLLFPNFCLTDINNNSEYKLYLKELISKYSK